MTDDTAGRHRAGQRTAWRHAAALLTVAVAVRVALAAVYSGPSIEPDSSSYENMSHRLFHLGVANYIGTRTPGYPAFLRVLGDNLGVVWLAQAVLGVAACMLVYWTVLRVTDRRGVALLTGLVLTASLDVLFFETEILTEALLLFVLTASTAVFTQLVVTRGRRAGWGALLGLLTALAALTRPESALLIVVWPLAFLVTGHQDRPARTGWRLRLAAVTLIMGPGIIAVAGWSAVNAEILGEFSPTTLSGFNLVDHLGSSVADAPSHFATIRDIYVRQRDRSIAAGHGDENVSYQAIGPMQRATGKGKVALSRELTSMSLAVIRDHPLAYAEITATLWPRSWDAPIYWQPDRLHPGIVRTLIKAGWDAERPLRILVNGAFLALCLSALTPRFRRYRESAGRIAMALMGVVLVMSIPQALLANGENGRYLFPYYPMMLVALALGVHTWRSVRRGE